MVYGWSDDDIKKDRDELYRIAKRESNIVKRSEIIKVIDATNEILLDDKLNEMKIKTLRSILMFEIARDINSSNRYYELTNFFYQKTLKYLDKRNILNNIIYNYPDNRDYSYISNDDVIGVLHDSYKSLDDELFNLFKLIYDRKHTLIKFDHEDDLINGNLVDGNCTYIGILNKNYIKVLDELGISKLINTAHEVGHAINNLYCSNNIYNCADEYLAEVASIFFEMIINYDVAYKIFPFDSSLKSMETFDNYFEYSSLLYNHKDLVNVWLNNNGKTNKDFYYDLRSLCGLSKNKTIESMNVSIDSEGQYVISYMVALELFNIYKQDKKNAIKLLKNIMRDCYKDSFTVITTYFKDLSLFSDEIGIIEENMSNEINKKLIK